MDTENHSEKVEKIVEEEDGGDLVRSFKTNNHEVNDEQKKVSLMRTFVQTQDPTSKDVDDLTLRRFLRARDLDIEKGSALFLKHVKWRRSFVPNGFISESEVAHDIAHNKVFMQGYDKSGQPILVIYGAKHFPNKVKGGIEEFRRFVVYCLDKLSAKIPTGQEKFFIVADLEGWGYYSNCDIRGYLAALSVLQDNYPERLAKFYLIHVPSVFMAAWKLIYPFIDNNTKKKFVFVDDKSLKSTLLEEISEDQLPEVYGGKLPLLPIEES
ncbi:hypothetical protein C5167_006894 [Papaver somniferum]|uniref:CRAL-TRIO domain-containing protein n=1 Tax=Papaver somniferum TaxID=3469 RepID=A0A4Y7JHS7_PAPSO|nr:sec14 cytosolic factor-like [Papaver somniferum]RZC59590.1 hypothetical protein C5167_006894 [Papaver somniferum]